MSLQQISRNADLKALLDDGYEVAMKSGHLVIYNVPYVNAQQEVKRGTLISVLELNDDKTIPPKDHKALFAGEHPCDKEGKKLGHLEHNSSHQELGEGLSADHSFSCKPKGGYENYHHKMTTYAEMISKHARAIDPDATARTYVVATSDDPDSVFNYADTASTRAGIAAISNKLALNKVGIIGLGGSGGYILDLIAKTPVREIHLFDSDDFLQHNAFRAPGAATLDTLKERPKKVDYLANQYASMRNNIIAHPVDIDEENVGLLNGMDFVFICVDGGNVKEPIVEKLEADDTPFVDVGMGIELVDDKLLGIVRVTASTPAQRDHFRNYVGFSDGNTDDAYSQNIQIADLNALNATLAVIKWKKLFGFYADLESEHAINYTLDGNIITNSEKTS